MPENQSNINLSGHINLIINGSAVELTNPMWQKKKGESDAHSTE